MSVTLISFKWTVKSDMFEVLNISLFKIDSCKDLISLFVFRDDYAIVIL